MRHFWPDGALWTKKGCRELNVETRELNVGPITDWSLQLPFRLLPTLCPPKDEHTGGSPGINSTCYGAFQLSKNMSVLKHWAQRC